MFFQSVLLIPILVVEKAPPVTAHTKPWIIFTERWRRENLTTQFPPPSLPTRKSPLPGKKGEIAKTPDWSVTAGRQSQGGRGGLRAELAGTGETVPL